MVNTSDELAIERLRKDGITELSRQFDAARNSLRRLIAFRNTPMLRRRVDDSDVLQETYLEVARRLDKYVANPNVPPLVWMRLVGRQVLAKHYRRHFGTAKRSLDREDSVEQASDLSVGCDPIVNHLADSITSPSAALAKHEVRSEVNKLLSQLTPIEREVLCLKQIEDLTFEEIAAELSISVSTVKRKLIQATERFRSLSSFSNPERHQ